MDRDLHCPEFERVNLLSNQVQPFGQFLAASGGAFSGHLYDYSSCVVIKRILDLKLTYVNRYYEIILAFGLPRSYSSVSMLMSAKHCGTLR